MYAKHKIAVLGGGSWATGIVKILQENVSELNWYMRNKRSAKYIRRRRRNPRYLSSVKLYTEMINIFTDINEVIENSDILIFAIPSAFIKDALNEIKSDISDKIIVSAVKGLVPKENQIPSDYFHDKYNISYENICAITGPSHAEEVALERLSYLTIASQNRLLARHLASMLATDYVKTKTSTDIVGIEYSAVLKNIVALAAGICHGLRYGDNFQSVLIANSISEISKFVDIVCPHEKRNIMDSAYMGDILVTAYSQFSRNRNFGSLIGNGYTVSSARMEMNMIVEGYYAVKSIRKITREKKIKMPVIKAVYNILYKELDPEEEINLLADKLE